MLACYLLFSYASLNTDPQIKHWYGKQPFNLMFPNAETQSGYPFAQVAVGLDTASMPTDASDGFWKG